MLGCNRQPGGAAATPSFGAMAGNIIVLTLERARLKTELGAASARTEHAVRAYERVVRSAFPRPIIEAIFAPIFRIARRDEQQARRRG